MSDVLICADARSPALRHELGIAISERVVYAETGDARYVVASPLARPALEQTPDLTVLAFESYGFAPGLSRGVTLDRSFATGVLNVCRELDISSAAVPPDFPLEVADELRTSGMELTTDREEFDGRRRIKTEEQLGGIRRAQSAAETALAAIRDEIQTSQSTTSEELRELGWAIFVETRLRTQSQADDCLRRTLGTAPRSRLRANPTTAANSRRRVPAGASKRLLGRYQQNVLQRRTVTRAISHALGRMHGARRSEARHPARDHW